MAAGQKLRGLVGQGMDGHKQGSSIRLTQLFESITPGAATFTALSSGTVFVLAWGGGGGGSTVTDLAGGGGGAVFKRLPIARGQTISVTVGAAGADGAPSTSGGDTIVVLHNGMRMTAAGGQGGTQGRQGGTGVGGDINRTGGNGATSGGTGTAGQDGGGAGGVPSSTNAGGGGQAGFASLGYSLIYSAGSATTAAPGPGAGGGSTATTLGSAGDGGVGKVLIYLVRNL